MNKKDMDIASHSWDIFLSSEEGKEYVDKMFNHPTEEELIMYKEVCDALAEIDRRPKNSMFLYQKKSKKALPQKYINKSTSADGWKYHKHNRKK